MTIVYLFVSVFCPVVALGDTVHFQDCMTGPGSVAGTECQRSADMDYNGTVDLKDWCIFTSRASQRDADGAIRGQARLQVRSIGMVTIEGQLIDVIQYQGPVPFEFDPPDGIVVWKIWVEEVPDSTVMHDPSGMSLVEDDPSQEMSLIQ